MLSTNLTLHKAIKYRINDNCITPELRDALMQYFGCARKVYNLYVDILYNELEKRNFVKGAIPKDIAFPEVSTLKKDYPYLKDVDSLALANAKQNFHKAIERYNEKFDHASYTKRALRRSKSNTEPLTFRGLKGMPKFKSKARGDFAYTTNCQYPKASNSLKQPTIRLCGNELHLPKLKFSLTLVKHRELPNNAVIGNVTISMDTTGRFYASVAYNCEQQVPAELRKLALNHSLDCSELRFLGLDYSQKHLYVDSEGRKANFPHFYNESQEKLARLQRKLSRMEYDPETHKGSKNYDRMLAKIQKLHAHIANQRKDTLHKESTRLANEWDVIVVEDLDLRAMGQCFSLGKNLHDNGFGMFRNMLDYKLKDRGSVLVRVPKHYASTKLCHCCGYKNDAVVLGVTEWVCPNCGIVHDRDINAALNIRQKGVEIFPDYFIASTQKDEETKLRLEAQKAEKHKRRHPQSA